MRESPENVKAREWSRRNREIRLIQIARRQLGLDEATYRCLLKRVASVNSSTELTADGRDLVLAELKRMGWKPAPATGAGRKIPEPSAMQGPQIKMIRGLWLELRDRGALRDASERALAAYCRRITGIEAVEWLTTHDAAKMIGSLAQWKKRIEQKQHTEQL